MQRLRVSIPLRMKSLFQSRKQKLQHLLRLIGSPYCVVIGDIPHFEAYS